MSDQTTARASGDFSRTDFSRTDFSASRAADAHEAVTVAPGQSLTTSWKWSDAEGVEHSSIHIAREGEGATVPASAARVLRAEGVIL